MVIMKKLLLLLLLISTNSFASSALNFNTMQVGGGMNGSDWVAYTPTTQGFGTIASVEMFYRRVGDSVHIMGNFTLGTTTAVEAQIGLPSGLTSDSVKVPSIRVAGIMDRNATSSTLFNVSIESNKTYMVMTAATSSGFTTKQNGNFLSTGNIVSINAVVPISGWTTGGSGTPLRSAVWVTAGNGHGSTNTKIRRFTTTTNNIGSAVTYSDSSTLGASFTINETGIYSCEYVDYATASSTRIGISVNSTQLTTDINSLSYSTSNGKLDDVLSGVNNSPAVKATFTGLLNAGDVIRAHTDATPNASTNNYFRITKVSN